MTDLADFRRTTVHIMLHDPDSPLTEEQKRDGQTQTYYDENPDLHFSLDLELYDTHETVEMQTSTGDVALYLRWGKLSFEVNGEGAQLTVYRNRDGTGYFVPFADATSGTETYGAGRYLEIADQPDGRVLVDFNYAYNPYCAYNERWSCPLTPGENRLTVPIRAGERVFK